MKRLFVLVSIVVLSSIARSTEMVALEVRTLKDGERSPSAEISDLTWLSGRWSGEGLGGFSEEIIAPPVAGQMMGMFRQTDATGDILFYEFYLFAEINGSLVLRIKHFGSNFVGWEEKDLYEEFPLVAVENNAVYFDGLTYALEGENILRAAVKVAGRGIITFEMPRSD